jgi:hypothetical protein
VTNPSEQDRQARSSNRTGQRAVGCYVAAFRPNSHKKSPAEAGLSRSPMGLPVRNGKPTTQTSSRAVGFYVGTPTHNCAGRRKSPARKRAKFGSIMRACR